MASTTHRVFARELDQEILHSERLRISILIGIFAMTMVISVPLILIPGALTALFGTHPPPIQLGLVILLLLAYEVLAWFIIGYSIRAERHPPAIARYMNALVEVSVPTIVIYYAASVFGPIPALVVPPAMLYYLFIVLSALRLDVWICVFTGAVAAAQYLTISLFFIAQPGSDVMPAVLTSPGMNIGRAAVIMLAGIATAFVTLQIRRRITNALSEVEERNRIIGLFGQHVSPAVVERLIDQQTVFTSESRDVCIMFLDIRDFTQFAEKKDPQEVVSYLNSLFEFMVESVNRHEGIINKFLGDGFMAVFGAPISSGEDARNAVACAREIVQRVEQFVNDGQIDPTRVGIGLHAGQAVTGNIGTLERQEYTIIGDVVNLASRIEQLNKRFDSQLLVSQSVWQELDEVQQQGTTLGAVDVRGHDIPVEVYRLA